MFSKHQRTDISAGRLPTIIVAACCATVSLVGCSDDSTADHVDSGADVRAEPDATDTGRAEDVVAADLAQPDEGPALCRAERTADTRRLVIAHPFSDIPGEPTGFEVFDVDAAGAVSATGVSFEMGKAADGEIQFTPDGVAGFVAQDGGSIGAFNLTEAGVDVTHAAFDPGYYVSRVFISPDGTALYAVSEGFRDVGGGVYRLAIDCGTGALTNEGLIAVAKLPRALHFAPGDPGTALLAAVDLMDSTDVSDVHLLDLSADPPTRIASSIAFADDQAIVAGFDVTHDGRYVLLGDNAAFTGIPNRIAVALVGDDRLMPTQEIVAPDPAVIVTSPYNNAAIVLSTTADRILEVGYSVGAAGTPFAIRGQLATAEPSLLPVAAAMVERGDLRGSVFVSENVGIRLVRFEEDGSVTDGGFTPTGAGSGAINGAIGIQP